jgi:hypothetical protein
MDKLKGYRSRNITSDSGVYGGNFAEVNGAKGSIVETPRRESLSGSPRAILIYACAAAIRVRSGTTFLVTPSMIVRR